MISWKGYVEIGSDESFVTVSRVCWWYTEFYQEIHHIYKGIHQFYHGLHEDHNSLMLW